MKTKKSHKTVEVGEASAGKAHKGRKLSGHKGGADEAGEAVVIVKEHKAKKEKHAAAEADGEALSGKHSKKGRGLLGHKGDGEAGEATVVIKAPK